MEEESAEIDEESQHETDKKVEKAPNKFEYIKIVKQTTSTVVLEWKYIDNTFYEDEKVFKIVKLKNRDEWETICWSRKSMCVIKNLEQNTCYSIKINVMTQMTDKFHVVDSSDVFKVSKQYIRGIWIKKYQFVVNNFSARYKSFHHTTLLYAPFKSLNCIY